MFTVILLNPSHISARSNCIISISISQCCSITVSIPVSLQYTAHHVRLQYCYVTQQIFDFNIINIIALSFGLSFYFIFLLLSYPFSGPFFL